MNHFLFCSKKIDKKLALGYNKDNMSYSCSDYSMKNATEEELCRRAQEGDRTAEEILAVRCSPLVKSCARPYFLAGADSEDLIQEGMLGLLKAIRSFDPERGGSFYAFARTCVLSRIYSALRSAAASKHRPLNQAESISEKSLVEEAFDVSAARSVEDPVQLLISQEEKRQQWEDLSERLSPFENDVLELFLKGLSYPDMAEKLGKPVKSVDNAIQRIRRKAAPILHGGSTQ